MNAHTAEIDAARFEVRTRLPGLMWELARLRGAGIEPSGALIPARLNVPAPPDPTGAPATDAPATCMGLPITWSDADEWGLIVTLPRITSPGKGAR